MRLIILKIVICSRIYAQWKEKIMEKEKLQRFSIRKLSIGAVSCLIGTVSFLSYSHNVQAAEKPQTVEAAKTNNETQPENVQESIQNEEAKGSTQNAVVDKNTVGSQETGAVTTVNQTGSKENAPVANKAKQNIADLAISTKMKLQAIRLAKPVAVNNSAVVNTLDQNKLGDTPKVVVQPTNLNDENNLRDPNSKDVEVKPKESSNVDTNEQKENDVSAASASTVLSKQPANADTQLASTTSGVQPFMNLAVESDNNDLTPKRETVDSTWTLHYVNQADHKQELKDPTVITMQYERTNTPQSDGTTQYGDWSYVPGSFKQTGTPITVNDSDNPVKQDNVDKNGENMDVFTITAMYPTVSGYDFHNGINGTRLHDDLVNDNRQADTMSKDFYAEYDVAKPTRETVTSQWTIHYVNSADHKQELKAPTVITMQYTRTDTPQSNGKIQYGDWSYVPGSFKQTGTLVEVNGSDNPVKEDNVDNNGKNEDVFSIIVKHPNITGYEFHNGINGVRLSDYLLNNESNGEIQAPTMSKDGYVEYDVAKERSVAVKFVDDQSFDWHGTDYKKQVGQAVTVTGRDGDTVDLKLTVPNKYQLADGQQLPTTYIFKKDSGDLVIHLKHQVAQREATIDVKLAVITAVHFDDNGSDQSVVTQAQWNQLDDELKSHLPGPRDVLYPLVKVGTLTGHVGYDLVNGDVVSFGDDWTSLNLGGRTYQLPNGTEIVNGIVDGYVESFGKKLKSVILTDNTDVDPDYVNRPWHGYLSVNATNNSNAYEAEAVRSKGLQAGLVGDEPNALAKATGDRVATGVKTIDKTIDLGWLQDNLYLRTDDFSEQNGQLRSDAFLAVMGAYVPYVEKTVTRTIKVTTPDGKTTTVEQTATLEKQVDLRKEAHPAWTTSEWSSYDVPTIQGYTVSQSSVAKEAVTGMTKDQTVNITYTANDGTQTIVYQDEDGSEIDKQVISGKTDEKVKVTPDVPDGYVLKGEVPSEVTIKPDDTPITVTVEHGKSHVTPDKPVNKGDLIEGTKDKHYPEGLTHDDLNKTVTRTVDITDPSGKKTTSVQTVTFTRGATVDDVTGEVAYDNWSENGKHTFDKVDVPYITGYRSSEEVPEVTVTPDSKSNTVNVTYVAKTYDVYIFYKKVSTSYDKDGNDNHDGSDGSDFIFDRKSFDRYVNGEVGIAKPEVLRGHYGESINIPIKQVQGYYVDPYRNYSNYKFGMDAITGQELSWYDFSPAVDKDLKDPLPENASESEKENSMPRFIFVDYVRDYAHSGYNNSGYNIGYVDTEGAVISRPTNLRGISGTDTNYTAPTFEGYTLTNPQEVPTKFGKTSKDIFLVYKPQDVKVTYHYVDETGKQLVPSYVENNHFTGLTHVGQKDAKTIPGYSLVSTPEQTVVDGLKDLDLYFTYKANDGSQTISYQDNGREVGKQVITGKTDQTVKVTPEVPDGYVVKSEIPKEVTIRAKDDAIVIVVEHGKAHISPDKPVNKGDLIEGTKDKHYPSGLTHDDLNKTITRKVTIIDPTGKKTITMQTVTFTRDATVDEVTGEVTYGNWSEGGKHTFEKADVPTVPGYTASGDVPSVVVTPESKSTTVKITYTATDGSQTILYEDKNDGEAGKQVVPGKTDQTVKVTPEIPDGYVVTGEVPSEVTIKPKDTPIVVHVEHGKSYVTPDKPVNKGDLIPGTKDKHYPDGLTHDDLNKTVTRDVEITTPDGRKTSTHQEVTFTRGATVDEVTGEVTYGTWSEGGKHTFEKADVPTVPGYTASGNVPSVVVTPESKSSIVKITYTENGQKASENSSNTDVTDQNDANVDENNNGHQIGNDPTDDKSNDSNKDREKVKKTRKSGQLGLNNNSNSRLSKENKGFTKPDKDNFEQAKQEKQLPQAGESKESLSIMGLVATALFGVFSFGLKKKKKE